MACNYFNVTISQSDLNNATGNSDPDLDGKVFISYTDCNGEPTSIEYSSAGTYPNAFCADPSEPIITLYWNENLGYISRFSYATEGGSCVAPTPSPTVTPSISISPTPSTTPLYTCNCINFTNTTSSLTYVSYTRCNNTASELVALQPNESLTVCGSNPGVVSGPVTITVIGNCVGRNCIPFTPTPTPSTSITPSFSVTPSITPSNTPSISVTPSVTPSISVTPTVSPSKTIPPSMTPTPTISVSKTPSLTPLPSVSKTPSISVTPSITPSNGTSPTPTPSLSTTGSIPTVAGLCMTIEFGAAPSITPSITVSRTPSATPTATPSITPSVTPSSTNPPPTRSVTPSKTPSVTVSTTPSRTPSITPSVTPSAQPPLINCASCNVQALPNTNTGTITSGNLIVNTTYSGPALFVNPYPGVFSNCTNINQPLNTILLGYNPGNFTYTLNFNQPVNNIKILMSGGGLYVQPSAVETFTFNTNSSIPTLSLCGTSCDTTISNNTVSFVHGTSSGGGSALIQANASTPYTQLTITGVGGSNGVEASICLDTAVPLPSSTPSRTPSTSPGFAASCNTVLYRTQTSQYYSYNFTTNVSTLLNVAPNPNPTLDTSNGVPITLAHTNNKSWVYAWDAATNAMVIRESDITLTPFTSTFSRNIALPAGYKPANGLVAINDTTLVGINRVQYPGLLPSSSEEYFVVEYNILGTTAVATIKFKTPQFKKPVGGFIRTTGSSPKIIMLTQPNYAPGSNLSLSQYDYNTGQLEVLHQLAQPASPNNTGLATANGNLYIMGFNVYKINTTLPYATTFIQSPGTQLVNASQLPSCSNVVLMPHTCYGGLPPINVPNTVTYSEITISATGTGAATQMWDVPYNTCDVINGTPVSPNSILLGQKTYANPQPPTNFSYTMNFSQAVNNVGLLMAAANGNVGQSPESFTFTSNGGVVSISSNNNCFSTISGNTITANEGGVATGGGAGTFSISAPTPFTQLTVAGPGGLGGTLMSIDCENLFAAPIVTPSPTPSPTPSISPGTNTLGCVYFTKNANSYLYNVTNNTSIPVTIPGIFGGNETHTLTKYWKGYNYNIIREWNITSIPNVLVLNRTISIEGFPTTSPDGFFKSFINLQAINNTTLLTCVVKTVPMTPINQSVGSFVNTMTLFDIETNTVGSTQQTPLFTVYAPAGNLDAFLLTTNNKLITIGRRGVNGVFPGIYYLSQYSYPDGALELDIDISSYLPNTTNPHYSPSLFQSDNGKLYLHVWAQNISNISNIYEINLNPPYNFILVRNDNSQRGGYFNSSLNCNTVALNQPPQPSPSVTPTPSLTPPVSPNVGVNTIYKYLDIL